MNQTIEGKSREQIAEFLPEAIATALRSYHRFSQLPVAEEAKDFTDHHKACKVAVAHIELLLKLARWADLPDSKAGDHNHQILLAALMQEAEAEVAQYQEEED